MKDRVPVYPNKFAVYDESHNFIRYEYHERADAPLTGNEGDALNKANLLPDALCTLLGIATTSLPKDALTALKTLCDGNTTLANAKAQIATGSYTGTGTYGSGNPNSYVFSFAPKIALLTTKVVGTPVVYGGLTKSSFFIDMSVLTTSYMLVCCLQADAVLTQDAFFAKKSADGKTLYWYHETNASRQFNDQYNRTYYMIGIG